MTQTIKHHFLHRFYHFFNFCQFCNLYKGWYPWMLKHVNFTGKIHYFLDKNTLFCEEFLKIANLMTWRPKNESLGIALKTGGSCWPGLGHQTLHKLTSWHCFYHILYHLTSFDLNWTHIWYPDLVWPHFTLLTSWIQGENRGKNTKLGQNRHISSIFRPFYQKRSRGKGEDHCIIWE